MKGYNLLVISMDNEKGKQRRSKLNYPFIWVKGLKGSDKSNPIVKEVTNKFLVRYNQDKNSQKVQGYIGNFSSHIKVLKHIVNNNLKNSVILEDDSQLEFLPPIAKLPKDAITQFSGRLQPKRWEDVKSFHQGCEPQKIIKTFKKGLNKINHDDYRFTQSNAIYVPNKKEAQKILDTIEKAKHYKSYDFFLNDHHLLDYLWYPAPFTHDDLSTGSSITKGGEGRIKNYILTKPPTNRKNYYNPHCK